VNIVRQQLKTVQTNRAEVVGNEYINHDCCTLFFSREILADGSKREKKRTRNVQSDEGSKEAIAFMDDRPCDRPKLICSTLRVRGGVGIF
jgi:hypothetical protein